MQHWSGQPRQTDDEVMFDKRDEIEEDVDRKVYRRVVKIEKEATIAENYVISLLR